MKLIFQDAPSNGIENKDWNSTMQVLQEGVLWQVKEILGRIRSKFANIPGPSGGMQLDGQTLLAESKVEKDQWMQDLLFKYGEVPFISMG